MYSLAWKLLVWWSVKNATCEKLKLCRISENYFKLIESCIAVTFDERGKFDTSKEQMAK